MGSALFGLQWEARCTGTLLGLKFMQKAGIHYNDGSILITGTYLRARFPCERPNFAKLEKHTIGGYLENNFKFAQCEISDELFYFLNDTRSDGKFVTLPEIRELFDLFTVPYAQKLKEEHDAAMEESRKIEAGRRHQSSTTEADPSKFKRKQMRLDEFG